MGHGGPSTLNLFSHSKRYRVNRMRYGESRDQEGNRDVEVMWRELFGGGPEAGSTSEDGKALGGTRKAALGICALARVEAGLDSAQATLEGLMWRDGEPGEGIAGSHWLLSGEAGGVSPEPRVEGLRIEHTSVSEEDRVGEAQHQKAKAPIPEWSGDETP